MEEPKQAAHRNYLFVIVVMAILLLLLAGTVGWLIGRDRGSRSQPVQETSSDASGDSQQSSGRVTDLVAFDVPGGWKQAECEGVENVVYFVPSSTSPDCNDVPSSSISLAVDPQERTDCNQLQNVQDVSKHICKSIFIDNHKTLQAQTIYNQDSTVLPGRTVDAYYIDTGNGVVVARYIYSGSGEHGTVFNDLVMGLRVRN